MHSSFFLYTHTSTSSDALVSVSRRPRRFCDDIRSLNIDRRQPIRGNDTLLSRVRHAAGYMVDGDLSTAWQSVSRNKAYMYGSELAAEKTQELEAQIDLDLLQVSS